MRIRRIGPKHIVSLMKACAEIFYSPFSAFSAMGHGWIVTYVSSENQTAQITVIKERHFRTE